MPRHHLSERATALVGALNRRGIRGPRVLTILKRHSQHHVALQIDYYDHEVVYLAKLPVWAATPWLAHRIRHNPPAPDGFRLSTQTMSHLLGLNSGRRPASAPSQKA